jgi:hypothetical protein
VAATFTPHLLPINRDTHRLRQAAEGKSRRRICTRS